MVTDVVNKLNEIASTTNNSTSKSNILYLLSLAEKDISTKIRLLNESIQLNPKTVFCYLELSVIFAQVKDYDRRNDCINKGLSNVTLIIEEGDKTNIADYDFFIRESIIGSIMTKELYDYWKNSMQ
ncbi:MAG: hypothetical protein ACK5L5_04020 [Bacteroidales bacterium]